MNPGLSEVVGAEAFPKPSDVNRVASNQNTPMELLILQVALLLRVRPFEGASV